MANNELMNISLTDVITTAVQIPGVKVDRTLFLKDAFKDVDLDTLDNILNNGPVNAGMERNEMARRAKKLINDRTLMSSGASFMAGLPGGLAMAATIPADMLQFYGVALRLAQELAYLYGEDDLWTGDLLDEEKVHNQLILYCGVMLGATGASQTVRVLSSALAKQALKKLPQQALTKTFYYPIIKSICKFFGVTMTKQVFGKGVSKVIPVIGGVVSGGITLATMKPMGQRLADTFDEAHYDYTQEEFEKDFQDIIDVAEEETANEEKVVETVSSKEDKLAKIKEAKQMFDDGILDEEEFKAIKAKLISEM